MIAFLGLLLHIVVSPFRTKVRLEAEIILLRHQLNVLVYTENLIRAGMRSEIG
jgi:hypothetical protein